LDGSFRRVDVVEYPGAPGVDVAFDGQYTFNPSLSADGTAIAFQSDARNVVWTNGYGYHTYVVTAFSKSPESASYPQEGGAGAIEVDTTPVSGWTASTGESWIV